MLGAPVESTIECATLTLQAAEEGRAAMCGRRRMQAAAAAAAALLGCCSKAHLACPNTIITLPAMCNRAPRAPRPLRAREPDADAI